MRRRRSVRVQVALGVSALVVGVAGLYLRSDGSSPAADFLDIHGRRWSFTAVVPATGEGVVLAADGIVDLRDGCRSTGRVAVAALPVNPASDPGDVIAAIDVAAATDGVGRIVGARRSGVILPDGSYTATVPLGPLDGISSGSLCGVLVNLVDALEDEIGSVGSVDLELDRSDLERGRERVRFAGPTPAEDYRYEVYVDGSGGRGVVTRRLDGDGVALGSVHLEPFDPLS